MKKPGRLFILVFICIGVVLFFCPKENHSAILQCPVLEQFAGTVFETELAHWTMENTAMELEGQEESIYSMARRYDFYNQEQKIHCQFLNYVSRAKTAGIMITFLPADLEALTEKEYEYFLDEELSELWILASKLSSDSKAVTDLQEQLEAAYGQVADLGQYTDRISYFSEWGAQSAGIYATARMVKQEAGSRPVWYQIKLVNEAEYTETDTLGDWKLSETQALAWNEIQDGPEDTIKKGMKESYFIEGKLSQIEKAEDFCFYSSPYSYMLPANTCSYQQAILTDESGILPVYIAPTALSKKELSDRRLHMLQRVQNKDHEISYVVIRSCLTE